MGDCMNEKAESVNYGIQIDKLRKMEESIQEDADFKELRHTEFNVFDVLKIGQMEIRHSNVLSWLLDPNGSHGKGGEFLRCFFEKVLGKDRADRLWPETFTVRREWENIDILLISEVDKTVIAIENKILSKEHDDQLQRYHDIIEKEYSTYKKEFFYLTPQGDEPTDDRWNELAYILIYEILDEKMKKHSEEKNDRVDIFIEDYMTILKRDIIMNDDKKKLIEMCDRLYSEYGEEIETIINNKTDPVVRVIKDILKNEQRLELLDNISASNFIVYSEAMDKYLGKLHQGHKSRWKDDRPYRYWYYLENGKLKLTLYFDVRESIPAEIKDKMDNILKKEGNETEAKSQKSVYSISRMIEDATDEKSIKDAVCGLIKEQRKKEQEWGIA